MNAFRLPDLGEGLAEAEIVQWHVAVGDQVEADQLLVSLETAKAVVDVPSPRAGRIGRLCGEPGQVLNTGDILVEFADELPAGDKADQPLPAPAVDSRDDAGTVVGRIQPQASAAGEQDSFWTRKPVPSIKEPRKAPTAPTGEGSVQAMPRTRSLARQWELELDRIPGTGPGGQITEPDLRQALAQHPGHFQPLGGARKRMAEAMALSAANSAQVTLHDVADISAWPEGTDLLIRVIQAMVAAAGEVPQLNAWFDARRQGLRLFDEINLGLAIDSEHGLYVPVIEQVSSLDTAVLRQRIDWLSEQVRNRRPVGQSVQASMTLSNFGAIAGRFATPMLILPQVAILGIGRCYSQADLLAGQWQSQRLLPLSLTFDHRACTGGEACRFMRRLQSALCETNY